MTPSPRILIAVATYNEIDNLPRLVDELRRIMPDADLLVIDDNSPDGTGRWAAERAACNPRMQALVRAGKLGLGTAILAAFEHAIAGGYDVLLTLDADFSHPPEAIPALLELLQSYAPACDVAIGSRYVPGGKIVGWPWHRRLMSRMMNGLARALLRLKVRDTSGNFRAYRVATLRKLDRQSIRSRGYSFFEEVLWRLAHCGAVMRETPITFEERQLGKSKINIWEAFRAVGMLFRLGFTKSPFAPRK